MKDLFYFFDEDFLVFFIISSLSIGLIIEPILVLTFGNVNLRNFCSGFHVRPIGWDIFFSKSLTFLN
jgi:hypothetical protein